MINCELFSHVYFATLPMPRSCEHLGSLGKFGFRSKIGLSDSDFGRVRASNWGPFTTLGWFL